ncbi:MAG: DUF72 domain-containing protein [Planctomycetota bacterium]
MPSTDFPTDPSLGNAPSWPVLVGAPVWACSHWAHDVYPTGTARKHWLAWYSRHFNTVEGNSTFYAVPSQDVFEQWADRSAPGFQFCLKFPRVISHERTLVDCEIELREFCERLEILAKADRLGPTFLQLGPSFGPDRLPVLTRFVASLPREFPWAVEVRHPGWFGGGSKSKSPSDSHAVSVVDPQHWSDSEKRLHELLATQQIDRVVFDSRALFQLPPDDPIEVVSQQRKPRVPVRPMVSGSRPMIRVVGRNRIELAKRFLDGWAPLVHAWLQQGLSPIVFLHAPDDRFAPELAREFLRSLQNAAPDGEDIDLRIRDLGDLEANDPSDNQLRLFG